MKTMTTIKDGYLLDQTPAALEALRAAIKTSVVRMLTGKQMNEKEMAQALNLSGKREHYWQQITMGSSRL